jgi:Zn2+/Cd2+-exporting ATPase
MTNLIEASSLSLPDPDTRCTQVLSDVLRGYSGIREVEFDVDNGRLQVAYDPRVISDERATNLIRQAGEQAWERVSHCYLKSGNACEACLHQMSDELVEHYQKLARVHMAPFSSFDDGVMTVTLDNLGQIPVELNRVEESFVPETKIAPIIDRISRAHLEIVFTVVTLIAGLAAALGQRIELLPQAWVLVLYVIAYLSGGYYGLMDGLALLRKRRLDVNLLMITAAIGAALIGQPAEGVVLLFLFSLSNTLQTFAMGRSRKAIEKLMDLRPPVATVKRGSRLLSLPIEDLVLGDIVLVRPGERFPIDGVVTNGTSDVDQSTITGESIPVQKERESTVFAGTVNGNGALEIRVTRLAQNTTLAKIVQMVEEAQSNKAQTQRMLDNFEQTYAILVLSGAALLTVIPFILLNHAFEPTFYRAMTLLVVASPCALVISTPASILSAIANGARKGVLFKGGAHLEQTAGIKVIAFDKTGTLTTGEPSISSIVPLNGTSEDELLRIAASVEARSEHPLAQAIVHAAEERGLTLNTATEFQAIPGQGVEANIRDQEVWIGNLRMFSERRVFIPQEVVDNVTEFENKGQTVMIVYASRDYRGLIAVADTLRPDAAEIILKLKERGVEKVVMLTGDNEPVARNIAERTGVDEYHSSLLPQDKVMLLKKLQQKYGLTAMVGDGVNDAPALASADVGIAMGGAGTDVALETADVVLMSDDLAHLPYAIGLAQRSRATVWQNLVFSLAVIVLLVSTVFGANLPLTLGVIGHEGSTVLVVLNGLRLLRYRG